jgi:hypothetical protein
MSEGSKLVVYYSCFNYEINVQDFSHIAELRNFILSSLGEHWLNLLRNELEFLNISLAKYSLELCCEIYSSSISKGLANSYVQFKQLFIEELLITNIWTPDNIECNFLDELLRRFYDIVRESGINPRLTVYKILPSLKQQPELQPLVVAEEAVTTFSERVCHVLKKVSLPLETLIGPEIITKISDYIKCLSSRVIKTHQVTSNFVTNIIEIRPNANQLKVRVIQPAKEFYDKVVECWGSLTDRNNSTCFLISLRHRFGDEWSEKLVSPALCFFDIAQEEWAKGTKLGYSCFLTRLQERLIKLWRQSIIEASKTFQEHMVTKTVM